MIYFVHAPALDLVKIGLADDPRKRFSKIQSDSPTRLVLRAIHEGGPAEEASLHTRFTDYRARGEWFRYTGGLRQYIEALPPLPAREKSLNSKIVALGVSKAHASLIVNGKHQPSLTLAVAIWRATGWKCQRIAHATDDQLAVVEQIETWAPRGVQQEAA